MARLGDVCIVNPKGKTLSDELEVSFVPMQNVSEDGNIDITITKKYCDVKKGFTTFENGDILFAKITPCMENGKGGIARHLKNGIGFGSTEFHVLRPNLEVVTSEWIYYLTTDPEFRKRCEKNMTGSAGQKRVPKSFLETYEFSLPSLNEQRRIAAILDKVTSLIALRKQQLAKLDELVKARFVEMFGEPVTNPMGWPVHRLSEYIIFLTSGSRGWSKYFTDAGEIFITIKNVKDCKINLNDVQYVTPPQNAEAKRTKVQEGDLLISITADLGRTGVVSKEIAKCGGYINQHLTCIRLQKEILHPLYIAYYMESEAGKRQFHRKNQAGVKAGLNFDSIKSLTIALPPIEVQNSFVSYVSQIDRQMLTIRQGLDILKMLQKSMMQDYFESRGDGK